jgi:hypothetical protein
MNTSLAYLIDYGKIQHAGEIGYYAFGIGKNVSTKYRFELFHGVVPKHEGGIRIETMAMKHIYRLSRFDSYNILLGLYVGLNIYKVKGARYEPSKDNAYPKGYYRIGSIRALFFLGSNISLRKIENHKFYFESGMNDIVLQSYFLNSETVNPLEYVSLAVGYKYHFK